MASNVGESQRGPIDTFVFFDLETTDLIRSGRMPRITELAMIAASRNSLHSDKRDKMALPRILHKLSIPVCPMEPINADSSYISDLWNDTLDDVQPFDDKTYDMIMQFIGRLPGLVCLVAHNGNRFDYPVFLTELERIGKAMPDSILCVDSLPAFQEFYSDKGQIVEPVYAPTASEGRDEVDEEVVCLSIKTPDNLLVDDWNEALYSVLDDYKNYIPNKNISCVTNLQDSGKDVLDSITNKAQKSEHDCAAAGAQQISPKSMQLINEKTPESQIIKTSTALPRTNPRKLFNGARKQLNFGDSKPKNFKLCTLHAHLIGRHAENQHCAEADCLSLLRCVCQLGPYFGEWADSNAVPLNLFKQRKSAMQ